MDNWQKENNTQKAIKIILFLLSPFVSAIYSLKSLKTKSSFIVLYLFAIFFGLSLTVESGKTENNKADAAIYRRDFERYVSNDYIFSHKINNFFSSETQENDVYFDILAYFISLISDNYHLLFAFAAGIFAFFALKSFQFLTSDDSFKYSYPCYLISFLFLLNDIFNINGMRFFTAVWVAVYAIFLFYKTKNVKLSWLLIFLTPFIHSAFWVFVFVFILAVFFKRFEKFWIFLFFLSFIFSSVAVEIIASNKDILPSFLAKMADNYTSKEFLDEKSTTSNLVQNFFSFLQRFYINLLVYILIKNSYWIKENVKTKELYLYLIVWMTFVNFGYSVPSLGVRFIYISYPIIAYLWLATFKGSRYNSILYWLPIVYAFFLFSKLINYINILEIGFYFSSPFILIYNYLLSF